MTLQANEGKDQARRADSEQSSISMATALCRRKCSTGVIKLIFGRPCAWFIQFFSGSIDVLPVCCFSLLGHFRGDLDPENYI